MTLLGLYVVKANQTVLTSHLFERSLTKLSEYKLPPLL